MLSESMLLWLPTHIESIEESEQLTKQVTLANGAILDFCDGDNSLADTLEIIEYYGANVDDYRINLEDTIRAFGI